MFPFSLTRRFDIDFLFWCVFLWLVACSRCGNHNLGYSVELANGAFADYASLHESDPKFVNNSCAPITHVASCDDVGFVKLTHARVARASEAPAVFVAAVVDTMRPALVPHFVKHYIDLGVQAENFLIVLHMGADAVRAARVKSFLLASKIAFVEWWGEFTTGSKHFHLLHALSITRPSDFIVWADLDEFHEFGSVLRSLDHAAVVNFFRVNRCNALSGNFVDRVASSGELAEIQPDVDIQLQFPLRCNVTTRLMRGGSRKTLLTSAALRTDGGHHAVPPKHYFEVRGMAYLLPSVPMHDRMPSVCHGLVKTAHFKWTAGALEYLTVRSQVFKAKNIPWWIESQRFLKEANNVRSFAKFCRLQ